MTRYVSKVEATDCCQAWEPNAQFPRRGKEEKRKGHCFKDLRQTKKGKSTHAIQETAVVTACQALKACGQTVAGVGSISSMTEYITRCVEAGGL